MALGLLESRIKLMASEAKKERARAARAASGGSTVVKRKRGTLAFVLSSLNKDAAG